MAVAEAVVAALQQEAFGQIDDLFFCIIERCRGRSLLSQAGRSYLLVSKLSRTSSLVQEFFFDRKDEQNMTPFTASLYNPAKRS
jgi:hypothetical protein